MSFTNKLKKKFFFYIVENGPSTNNDEKSDAGGEHEHFNGHTDSEVKTEKSDVDSLEIMQDNGFTISIVSPGMEPLSIQVNIFINIRLRCRKH